MRCPTSSFPVLTSPSLYTRYTHEIHGIYLAATWNISHLLRLFDHPSLKRPNWSDLLQFQPPSSIIRSHHIPIISHQLLIPECQFLGHFGANLHNESLASFSGTLNLEKILSFLAKSCWIHIRISSGPEPDLYPHHSLLLGSGQECGGSGQGAGWLGNWWSTFPHHLQVLTIWGDAPIIPKPLVVKQGVCGFQHLEISASVWVWVNNWAHINCTIWYYQSIHGFNIFLLEFWTPVFWTKSFNIRASFFSTSSF